MRIRPAEANDLAAIVEIVNREVREGVAHFGTEPVHESALAAEWRDVRYPWFVADEAGAVVGFARAAPWKSRGAYAWTVETGIYLRPERQGRGIGRALYDALLPELAARGFRVVVAGIALPNPASVRLHEAVGMRPAGVLPACGFKHGRWLDVGYWTLRLGDDGPPARVP